MITHSFFRVTCVCGELLRSERKTGTCPTCQREFRIEWPGDYQTEQQQKETAEVGRQTAA